MTDGRLVPTMGRVVITRWFRLRVVFAVGVLALVAIELSGHRSWPVVLLQVLGTVGIVVSSAFDVRDLR